MPSHARAAGSWWHLQTSPVALGTSLNSTEFHKQVHRGSIEMRRRDGPAPLSFALAPRRGGASSP
eukprot:3295909-Alexandrium_andersonii.AAC.1